MPLGRRFRSLKLWFVLRHYGIAGLQKHVRKMCGLAAEFATWVDASPDFERTASGGTLNLVCFRANGSDEQNEQLLQAVNATGRVFLISTKVAGRVVLRFCPGSPQTAQQHVLLAQQLLQECWTRVRAKADAEQENNA